MFECLCLGTYLCKNILFQLYHVFFIFLPKLFKGLSTVYLVCTYL